MTILPDLAEVPGADVLGELIGLLEGEAEGLGHFARGGAVAVGDDVRGHRGAVDAVGFVDVLDDALALIARRQIGVDVRPLAALLGEKSFEEQIHLHRIDGGDAEGVADGAVRRGAAPLHEDFFALAKLDDVPDDEKVRRERPEADARVVPCDLAKVGHRRLANGQRVVGELIAEVRQGEVEGLGELPGVVEGLRQAGEEAAHLRGAFDMTLAVDAEEPARGLDVHPLADAREDIVQLFVLGARIADAVRGEDRQPQPFRDIE